MTDFEHKYEVELESAIFERLNAKFAKTIIIRLKRNVAACLVLKLINTIPVQGSKLM